LDECTLPSAADSVINMWAAYIVIRVHPNFFVQDLSRSNATTYCMKW